MLNFKEIKSSEEAASIYRSIQSEVVEFEPIKCAEDLAKTYNLAQQEFKKK